jgi:hypothetical protein
MMTLLYSTFNQGVFKIINTVSHDKNHYTKVAVTDHAFLTHYSPENESIAAIHRFVNETQQIGGLLVMGRCFFFFYTFLCEINRE